MEPQNNQTALVTEQQHSIYKVTPVSKYLALTLFIILPFIGGYIGYVYAPEKIIENEVVIYKKEVVPDIHPVSNALTNQDGVMINTPREGDISQHAFPVAGLISQSWLENPVDNSELNKDGLAPYSYLIGLTDISTGEEIMGKVEYVYLNPLVDTNNLKGEDSLVPFTTVLELVGYVEPEDRSCFGDVMLTVSSSKNPDNAVSVRFTFADIPGVNCSQDSTVEE